MDGVREVRTTWRYDLDVKPKVLIGWKTFTLLCDLGGCRHVK